MEDYLLKIKTYVDELVGVEVLVPWRNANATLEGLPSDYTPILFVIES